MVEVARLVLQLLAERAAEGDVHLLEAAADAEYRQAGGDRGLDHRQRGRVALRVVPGAGIRSGPLVAMRLDIRGAAGEQDAVEGLEPVVQVTIAERGHEHGRRVRRLGDRVDVLFADGMEPVRAQ